MTGKQHILFGAVFGASVSAVGNVMGVHGFGDPLISTAFSVVGALLPDIDSTDSLIGQGFQNLSLKVSSIGHRTITHDLTLMTILTVVSLFVGNPIFIGIMLGIVSHLFLDAQTYLGIMKCSFIYIDWIKAGRASEIRDRAYIGIGRKDKRPSSNEPFKLFFKTILSSLLFIAIAHVIIKCLGGDSIIGVLKNSIAHYYS